MNMPKNFALRRCRKGTGVLPPNPNRWEQEHNALDLRHELSLPLEQRLVHETAYGRLLPHVHVLSHLELQIEACHKEHFTGSNSSRWSGMCVPCPNGMTLVIYNGRHAERRVRATLMEEFFHLWLDHAPEKLRMLGNGSAKRTYDSEKEAEAYGSGAAALVPYKALKAMVAGGKSVSEIADHFLVSEQLVEFRIRVSKIQRSRK